MKRTFNEPSNSTEKKSFFEYFIEVIGWLQIVVSPLLIGLIIGAIVYLPRPSKLKFIIAIIIMITGLCIGIIWANRIWKKRGTTRFMSSTMASPELDKEREGKE